MMLDAFIYTSFGLMFGMSVKNLVTPACIDWVGVGRARVERAGVERGRIEGRIGRCAIGLRFAVARVESCVVRCDAGIKSRARIRGCSAIRVHAAPATSRLEQHGAAQESREQQFREWFAPVVRSNSVGGGKHDAVERTFDASAEQPFPRACVFSHFRETPAVCRHGRACRQRPLPCAAVAPVSQAPLC